MRFLQSIYTADSNPSSALLSPGGVAGRGAETFRASQRKELFATPLSPPGLVGVPLLEDCSVVTQPPGTGPQFISGSPASPWGSLCLHIPTTVILREALVPAGT